jgi:hypothetical protein
MSYVLLNINFIFLVKSIIAFNIKPQHTNRYEI